MGHDSKKNSKKPLQSSKSSEKDMSNKDTNPAEGSSKQGQSNKNTLQSLKGKSAIAKKIRGRKLKTKTNGFQQNVGKRRFRKKKKVQGNGELPKENTEMDERNKEKESQNRSTNDKGPIEQSHLAEKNKSEQKQNNEDKHRKGAGSSINKTRDSCMENSEFSEKKREKLGGFIFMCSAKTKPDCFHYRVMGVSASKKDIVLCIKPGTKLFLYDFDLRLLYGIYKASSSGGMKLEPRAFGGNFPVQVRFNVASDCLPLPESVFKKAIKENYNEKNKFKTELTARQVRKLSELFRPVNIHSGLQPVRSPPKAIIHDMDAPEGTRGSWSHLHRERDPQIERQEEIPRDLFLTEKSYRAYGLHGDRRNVIPASQVNPIPDPYVRDCESLHLHQVDPLNHKNVPAHLESLHADTHYLNGSEQQTYMRGGIPDRVNDPYHLYRHGASLRDPYLPPVSREEISSSSYLAGGRTLIGSDNLQRREAVEDRLYSTYSAADALSEYNRARHYQESLEASAVPVSSRYSFAGPSYSLR